MFGGKRRKPGPSEFYPTSTRDLFRRENMEKDIERRFVEEAARHGMAALKFTSPGMAGMPDRMVLMPGGRVVFVEMKAPGEKPRPLQLRRHDFLRSYGFRVFTVDAKDGARRLADDLSREGIPDICD